MIDDPATVDRVMEHMEANLPIPATPSRELARILRQKGVFTGTDGTLSIKRVFYQGDEGGIVCDVTLAPDAKEALVVSLTHLQLPPVHPLDSEVRAYQRARVKRIARQGRPR